MRARPFQRPLMIAIGGKSGSGKTTLGMALSHKLPGAVLIDADVFKKQMLGLDPTMPLPDAFYASKDNIQRFIHAIRHEAAEKLKNHDIVIVCGLFIDENSRKEQRRLAERERANFIGLSLETSLTTVFNRFKARGMTPSDATIDVLKRQVIQPRVEREQWIRIDANQSFEREVEDALRAIAKVKKHLKYPAARPPSI